MSLIQVKPMDDLNEVFNTRSAGQLEVELPRCCVFRQKVRLERDEVLIHGNGSTIVWDDHNRMRPNFGTGASATLTIASSHVRVTDLEVVNSFDYVNERIRQQNENPAVVTGLQAVAVFTMAQSDDVVFENCTFRSYQDTLFADGVTNIYDRCTIVGNIDFIFGRSHSLFLSCTVVSNGPGFVTAPSTMAASPKGLCFENCRLTCTADVPDHSVFLARPWHPGAKEGVCSYVSFTGCTLDRHIDPVFWTRMHDGTGRYHYPEESRFSIDEKSLKTLKPKA